MKLDKIALDLRLFDGGTGDGAPGAEGTPAEPSAETATTEATEPSPEETAKARREAFEARIKGEDKEFYDERVQKAIKERFKETKKLESQLEKHQAVLKLVSARYPNVDASDPDAVMAALEQDSTTWERYAEEHGITPEMAKKFGKIEQENAMFRKQQDEMRKQQEVSQIYESWNREAAAVKQMYGNFDMQQELQNVDTGERFQRLIANGVDVKTAYEVIHKDELLGGALKTAVQTTQKKIMDDIKARGQRPDENGLSTSKAASTVLDVSKLTPEQLKDFSERARRGERITFKPS